MIYSFQYTVYSFNAQCYVFECESMSWDERFRYYKWIIYQSQTVFSYWCKKTGQGWIPFE